MIEKGDLSLLLGTCIVPNILQNLSSVDANDDSEIEEFYNSEFYEKLSNPKTGVWHLSPKLLAEMYERNMGGQEILYPEEQA